MGVGLDAVRTFAAGGRVAKLGEVGHQVGGELRAVGIVADTPENGYGTIREALRQGDVAIGAHEGDSVRYFPVHTTGSATYWHRANWFQDSHSSSPMSVYGLKPDELDGPVAAVRGVNFISAEHGLADSQGPHFWRDGSEFIANPTFRPLNAPVDEGRARTLRNVRIAAGGALLATGIGAAAYHARSNG